MLNAPEFFIEDGTFHTLCEVAGLVLDYWVEKIPYREQTAGVAFSYDQPDAEQKQANENSDPSSFADHDHFHFLILRCQTVCKMAKEYAEKKKPGTPGCCGQYANRQKPFLSGRRNASQNTRYCIL